MDLPDTSAFLEHVNTTPKKLGHNKLQLDIEALENEVEKWKLTDTEKEMKLALFKKTIATLQNQLQERAAQLSVIVQTDSQATSTTHADELQTQVSELQTDKDKLCNDKATLLVENAHVRVKLEELSSSNEELNACVVKLKDDNTNLKHGFETQTSAFAAMEQEIHTLRSQLGLQTSIVDNVTQELNTLKSELNKYKTTNKLLNDTIEQHETHIKQVSLQLEETESNLHQQLQPPASLQDAEPQSSVEGFPRRNGRRKRIYE
jgi:chromosome segregation ATPase